jgi:AcrR family transcriptional regulator
MTTARTPRRRRDPDRKERILVAAASLGARHGFDAISMADIGAEAGIVGSGVYRHFGSKTAILVAMADRVMDRLLRREAEIVAAAGDAREALSLLVRDHIEVALTDRDALAVYHREVRTLPEGERRRLSRAQRRYIEEWVRLLVPLRPDLAEAEARLAVHAAIGAIQSTLFFRSGLPDGRLTDLLAEMAHACLGTAAARRSGPPARSADRDAELVPGDLDPDGTSATLTLPSGASVRTWR